MILTALTQRPVRTVEPTCTILAAAKLMFEHSIGALVISDPSGTTPVGIVTDRDLLETIAEGLDPKIATVACFAGPPLETVPVHEGIEAAMRRMREHGVRRLPITDSEGHLVGIVSLDDVLRLLGREMGDVAETIEGELAHERSIHAARTRSMNPPTE